MVFVNEPVAFELLFDRNAEVIQVIHADFLSFVPLDSLLIEALLTANK